MTYPFVPGIDYGPRKGPVKAFVVHMAEGGNTVAYLRADATPPPRGVSVHYVIEYTGRIVQMVKESSASGSINPQTLRTTEGPVPYGATVRRQTMGLWDFDPNSATITLEIEGFAANGPNAAESAALVSLVNDVRSRFPDMGMLGHRDFTDTKACPGSKINWPALGGHGPHGQEASGVIIPQSLGHIVAKVDARIYADPDSNSRPLNSKLPKDSRVRLFGSISGWRFAQLTLGGVPQYAWLRADEITGDPEPLTVIDGVCPPNGGADCSVQDKKIADATAILSA